MLDLLENKEITKTDIRVYKLIKRLTVNNGFAEMKATYIADEIKRSKYTVYASVKRLVKHGFLRKKYILKKGEKQVLCNSWKKVKHMQDEKRFALTGTRYIINTEHSSQT